MGAHGGRPLCAARLYSLSAQSTKALHDRQPQDHKARRSRPVQNENHPNKGENLAKSNWRAGVDRRTLVKSTAALGAAQLASPFVMRARAADSVRIGLDNPLTGTYAAWARTSSSAASWRSNRSTPRAAFSAAGRTAGRGFDQRRRRHRGAEGAQADRARQGRLPARQRQLGAVAGHGAGVQRKGILHVVPGGHTDAVTGASCHWNVFRVCNTTQMEANAVAASLIKDYGKNFYYITPDYAFGHTLEAGLIKASAALGGKRIGGDLTPLGTVDFSSYLIKAQAANPDVIIFLLGGDDMVNALKQAVQFGLDKKVHLAGAQQELEPLEGLPPEARIGVWVMEWYWNQPGVPHVAEFVDAVKKRTGRVPTARTWFGYVSVWTCALAAAKASSLKRARYGEGAAGLSPAARDRARAESGLLSRRSEPAHRLAVRRRGPGRRLGAGRPVQGHQGRQRRGYRRHGRAERLQDALADLTIMRAEGGAVG